MVENGPSICRMRILTRQRLQDRRTRYAFREFSRIEIDKSRKCLLLFHCVTKSSANAAVACQARDGALVAPNRWHATKGCKARQKDFRANAVCPRKRQILNLELNHEIHEFNQKQKPLLL